MSWLQFLNTLSFCEIWGIWSVEKYNLTHQLSWSTVPKWNIKVKRLFLEKDYWDTVEFFNFARAIRSWVGLCQFENQMSCDLFSTKAWPLRYQKSWKAYSGPYKHVWVKNSPVTCQMSTHSFNILQIYKHSQSHFKEGKYIQCHTLLWLNLLFRLHNVNIYFLQNTEIISFIVTFCHIKAKSCLCLE